MKNGQWYRDIRAGRSSELSENHCLILDKKILKKVIF